MGSKEELNTTILPDRIAVSTGDTSDVSVSDMEDDVEIVVIVRYLGLHGREVIRP